MMDEKRGLKVKGSLGVREFGTIVDRVMGVVISLWNAASVRI